MEPTVAPEPPQQSPSAMQAYYVNAPQSPKEPPPGTSLEAQVAYAQQQAAYLDARAAYEKQHGPPPVPQPVVAPMAPGGGLPAARMGDLTAHGGTIVFGCPTVLIGKRPAARVTDMHTCPMVTGIVPHVGGPIIPPAAVTVFIGGLPAARMGGQCVCTGPPDTIALGEFTVFIA